MMATPSQASPSVCIACGAADGRTLYIGSPKDSGQAAVFGRFSSVRICNRCGHGQMAPMPSDGDLDTYYRGTFWTVKVRGASPVLVARGRHQADFVLRHGGEALAKPGPAILEAGAGNACLSRALAEMAGARGFIVEPDIAHREALAAEEWVHGLAADLSELPPGLEVDAALASHVLEHLTDPAGFLRRMSDSVTDGGGVMIEVPNCIGAYWRHWTRHWPHVQFFTPASLAHLMERCGLTIVAVETYGQDWAAQARSAAFDYDPNPEGVFLRVMARKEGPPTVRL